MPSQVAVDQQHYLRGGKWAYGKDDETCHREVKPDQQRHLPECHARAAHAQDRRYKIDRCPDAAEAGDEKREDPEIGAVSDRECLGSYWSVREPYYVRSVSRSVQA